MSLCVSQGLHKVVQNKKWKYVESSAFGAVFMTFVFMLDDDIDILLLHTISRIQNVILLFTLVKKLYQQVRTKYEYKQVVSRWAIVRSFIPAWKGHSLSSASCCSREAIRYPPTGRHEPLEFEVEWEVGR